jgi:monovalent cation/proton antiporter MnhG/PhaG subunit
MNHPVITSILLGCAVAIVLLCALGLVIMRDAYQRLQFATPVVSLSALLIAIAVFLEDSDPSARIKTVIIMVVLFPMNGILSHATARALRIKQVKHWPVDPTEKIPLHNANIPAGPQKPTEHA